METTTSFDLNRAIKNWRENLAQSPAFRSDNLDELESHLRDSVASLQPRGLSAEEAFIVATKRVGMDDTLEKEFGKVNAQRVWLDRFLWMLIGYQGWTFVSGGLSSIARFTLSLGVAGLSFDFNNHSRVIPVVFFTLVQLLAFAGSLAFCWWLIVRKGQKLVTRIERVLQRQGLLIVTCCALFVLSLFAPFLGYGLQRMLLRFTDMTTFAEVINSLSYSYGFAYIIQVATLITLTSILARKRLRLSRG